MEQNGTLENAIGMLKKSSFFESYVKIFQSFQNLTVVKFVNNEISSFPKELGILSHIKQLDLSKNNLKEFTGPRCEWKSFRNLTVLNLANNSISSCPVMLSFLPHLQELDLTYNNFKESTGSKWEWQFFENLKVLNLANNNISSFPKELGSVPYLQQLNLSANKIERTTGFKWEWQSVFRSLKVLNLMNNNISSFPKEVGFLSHLSVLNLSFNNLEDSAGSEWEWSGPSNVGGRLSLRMDFNNLTELPLPINKIWIYNLVQLNLANNDIFSLPKELGTLPSLMFLNLSYNNLGHCLPRWEWLEQNNIKNTLKVLLLCSNVLTSLPLQIINLKCLNRLNLHGNQLQRLPDNIGKLERLDILHLSNNVLSHLPGSIRFLNLRILNVESNPFDNALDNETNVHVLDGPRNQEWLSLVEYSARAVIRAEYDAASLPSTLATYLDDTNYCCICERACFLDYDVKLFVHYFLYRILYFNYFDENSRLPIREFARCRTAKFECFTCSRRCTITLGRIWASYTDWNPYNFRNIIDDDN